MKYIFLITLSICTFLPEAYFAQNLDMNVYVESEQKRIDSMDGRIDRSIQLKYGDEQKPLYTNVYFKYADSLQKRINESSILYPYQKKNLLYGLAMTLSEITGRTYQMPLYYQKLIENGFGILRATENGDLMSFLVTDPLYSVKNIYFYKYDNVAKDFLMRSTRTYPDEVLKVFFKFKERPYKDSIVETAAVIAPNVAKNYLLGETDIRNILRSNTNVYVMGMRGFFKEYNIVSKGMVLVDDIVEGNITIKEAHDLSLDKRKYLRKMIEVRNSDYAKALYSLDDELHNTSLEYVRQINELHNETDPKVRFASIDDFNWKELYSLLVYSEEEIFTSSFNGAFERLLYRMNQDKITGDKLLEKMKYNRFRTFIKICANYGKLGDFLNTMPRDKSRDLITKFTNNLDKGEADLRSAINVANAFSSIADTSLMLFMRDNIHRENERVNRENSRGGIVIYGLLKSLFVDGNKKDPNWYSSMANKYNLQPIDRIDKSVLFGRNNIHRQIHFFYDDEDGDASFASFLTTFSNPNYRITRRPNLVIIESVRGKAVKIYANLPKSEVDGQQELIDTMTYCGKDIQVMVHRGHSYYALNTIDYIPQSTEVVFLGSCGSYHNIHEVLQRASNVHIISSKQIGTMSVNNPILFNIAESVREGKDIVWKDIWKTTETQIKANKAAMDKFKDYVSPDRNLGAIFLQAYTHWVTSDQTTTASRLRIE